jgi:ATP/maltotriose-dependent transcriptional regulator MalT
LVSGDLTVDADTVTHSYLSLARVQQARGRGADARATLEEFANLARQRDFFPLLVTRGNAAQARLALFQGDLPAAVRWTEASGLSIDDEPSYLREEEYLILARVLVAQGGLDLMGSYLDEALGLLDRLLEAAEGGGRMSSVIEVLALRALTLWARRESSGALAALERALTLAEAEGYVRVFVDEGAPMKALLLALLKARSKGGRGVKLLTSLTYVRRLLAAFESPHTSTEPPVGPASDTNQPLPDPLTARETEVLELIADGLSNQEIAARLFIATSTVKGYVHSLLRKLEVDSRTKAISRAHELHLHSD